MNCFFFQVSISSVYLVFSICFCSTIFFFWRYKGFFPWLFVSFLIALYATLMTAATEWLMSAFVFCTVYVVLCFKHRFASPLQPSFPSHRSKNHQVSWVFKNSRLIAFLFYHHCSYISNHFCIHLLFKHIFLTSHILIINIMCILVMWV